MNCQVTAKLAPERSKPVVAGVLIIDCRHALRWPAALPFELRRRAVGGGPGVKRRHLVELEDLPWWPRVFRDAATDYLVTALRFSRTYTPLVPRLVAAVGRSGATQVTDL